jgi:hypothetical protein
MKICGDPYIEPHTCKMAKKHLETTLVTTPTTTITTINTATTSNMKSDETLDPEIFLKYNTHLHLEE